MKTRLIIMNFLQFAVWGAYLISMGGYLAVNGHSDYIGFFYAAQGIVSLFMPALIGAIADRWIPAQKMYGICHLISSAAMISLAVYGLRAGSNVEIAVLYPLFLLAIAFYMPSLSLSYSVAYNALNINGLDTVKSFPPIRTFGTIGFIASMWVVDLLGFNCNANQFLVSGIIGIMVGIYAFTLPECKVSNNSEKKSLAQILGIDSFKLLRDKKMATFMIFSALIGICLQITNGYATPYLQSFGNFDEFKSTFTVQHPMILLSLSQCAEALCILLIPYFLKKFGVKKVVLIAIVAWVLRFMFFGLGDPEGGVWMFVLSCIVYGVAFDFFNVSGSLYVDQTADPQHRSSAQGLLMLMTNGIGATVGMLSAQVVVNTFVNSQSDAIAKWQGWSTSWYIFAGYALIVGIFFALVFNNKVSDDAKKYLN